MDLRYPIGPFDSAAPVAPQMRPQLIDQIAAAPALLRDAVRGLNGDQLDTPYRPGGWTVRQTVHHVADSHMNSYVRLRLALTEEEPVIKPYDEAKWAELVDARTLPVEVSLQLLDNLHHRWVALLKSLTGADFARSFRHPALGVVRLDTNLALYAWHGRHHTAQITCVRHWLDCSVFSLASGLSSTTSADGLPPLFGCFVGTTPLYDSPPPCMRDLPLIAFSLRPATYGRRAATGSPGSRARSFSACMGPSTPQGRAAPRDIVRRVEAFLTV